MRIIALDTETTGLEVSEGHRIIEIGCVEIEHRRLTGREFHRLINPGRAVDAAAFEVHGIGDEQLADKPTFAEIEEEFLGFLRGADEIIIHNAPFDLGFLDRELSSTASPTTSLSEFCEAQDCEIRDTLQDARARHPGQRNSIDSLCKRYNIDSSAREKHGAALDARLLAQVHLAMTGGQISLELAEPPSLAKAAAAARQARSSSAALVSYPPSSEELAAHRSLLEQIDAEAKQGCLWLQAKAASQADA